MKRKGREKEEKERRKERGRRKTKWASDGFLVGE